MDRGNLSRRGFLQRSVAALAAAGVPAWYARELVAEEEKAEADARKVAASDRVVVGLIACGSRMGQLMGDLGRFKGRYEVVAACDVDRGRREDMAKRMGKDCKAYEDFRELLDHKDLNAVIIATPDHWHTIPAIAAMRAKKDVYCEKPLTLTIGEGKTLVKVAQETGSVFQVGSQQRSEYGGKFRLAVEAVRNGRVGKLKKITAGIGRNPTSPPIDKAEVPEGFNWDFWLGPTPEVDYLWMKKDDTVYTRGHYEFRWWYEYSGGKMTDWGAHHNDIAQWALGMDDSGPVSVRSEGEEPAKEPNRYNCHPTFTCTYRYANGVELVCTSEGPNGVRFEGEDGKWLFVSRGKIEASDEKILEEEFPADAERVYLSTDHMGNWLECIKTRKPCVCTAQVGHRSASVCHMGVISLRLGGRELKWDPAREVFVGDDEANKMLTRPMRAPWKLEV